jgi:hypothetical protein
MAAEDVVMRMTPVGDRMSVDALKEEVNKKSLATSLMTTEQLRVDMVCVRTLELLAS